ncbi:MAG: YesL family protein, partial [Clostridiales bacterium]|nr:YesL family protein [Clostridiales bacterium]
VFGKLMNNYYYGKSGKGDYKRDDLPRNRWQLFWEMLRIRLSGLFRLNLMTAIAFLPLIYVLVVMVNALFSHLVGLSEVVADPEQAALAAEVIRESPNQIYSILFSALVMAIPAIAITGPVQAGMAYITRNWARDEHAFIWADFKDAVKENWKQALGVSIITGLAPIIMLVCWQYYGGMAQTSSMLYVVPQVLTMALGIIWMMSLVFMYPMMVTYKMNLRTVIRNSLLLTIGRLPQTAGVRLVMLVPTLIAVLVAFYTPYMMYALMALAGYYILLGNALARFVQASFTNATFDRFINPRIAGVEVNRGLSSDEDLDDEEEEDIHQAEHLQ